MSDLGFMLRAFGFMYLVIGGTVAFCAFGYALLHWFGGWGVGLFVVLLVPFLFFGVGIAEWYDRKVMGG